MRAIWSSGFKWVGQRATIAAESEGNGSSRLELKFYSGDCFCSVLQHFVRDSVSLALPFTLRLAFVAFNVVKPEQWIQKATLFDSWECDWKFFFFGGRGGGAKKHDSHCQDNVIFPFYKYFTNSCHELNGTASLNGRFQGRTPRKEKKENFKWAENQYVTAWSRRLSDNFFFF